MAENGVAIPSDENDAPTAVFDASNSSTFDNEDYMSSDEEIVNDEEENEQKLEIEEIEEIEEKKHELNKILDANQIVLEPKVGMMFNSEEEVRAYYTQYAKQAGFGVSKRTSKLGHDGNLKYFTISCVNQGKAISKATNALKPKPKKNLGCKAKINATCCPDGKFTLTTVVLDHVHTLSPGKARYFRCHKQMDSYVKRRLELNDKAGIRISKNYKSIVIEAGGFEKLPFGEKDCRNHVDKARRLRLGVGGAKALRDYFVRMQEKDDRFYYVMDVDDSSRLRNVFWADARSRATCEYFGDVITFDTTYLTNVFKIPFAPFVGVNHHGQSILLGCGLISNENVDTFVWLFESWMKCMSGRAPKAIITDQDQDQDQGRALLSVSIVIYFLQSSFPQCYSSQGSSGGYMMSYFDTLLFARSQMQGHPNQFWGSGCQVPNTDQLSVYGTQQHHITNLNHLDLLQAQQHGHQFKDQDAGKFCKN